MLVGHQGTCCLRGLALTEQALAAGEHDHEGHVTYFDRREVCRHDGSVKRTIFRDGKERDELRLRCGTSGCGEWVVAEVDCEGYK